MPRKTKMDGPYYRKRAREIREEPERAKTLWVRNQLREIADRYDLLAIEADRAARLTSNQDTNGGGDAELLQQRFRRAMAMIGGGGARGV